MLLTLLNIRVINKKSNKHPSYVLGGSMHDSSGPHTSYSEALRYDYLTLSGYVVAGNLLRYLYEPARLIGTW